MNTTEYFTFFLKSLEEVANFIDKNQDGIDKAELTAYILKSIKNSDKKESNNIFKASDKDKDGLVSWQETSDNEFEDLSSYGDTLGK